MAKRQKATASSSRDLAPVIKSDQHWLADLNTFSVNLEICNQKSAEIFRGLGIPAADIAGLCRLVPYGQFNYEWWRADFTAMCASLATARRPQAPAPVGSQAPIGNDEEPEPDGPVSPDGFRHAGKVYDKPPLARGPFRVFLLRGNPKRVASIEKTLPRCFTTIEQRS